MKKNRQIAKKALSDKETVSRSTTSTVKVLELRKVSFTQNGKIKYKYQAVEKNKVFAERIDSDGSYVAGYVMKNYRHPFPFSIAHLFKGVDRIGKGESKSKRPYAIALDKAITVKEIFEANTLLSQQ